MWSNVSVFLFVYFTLQCQFCLNFFLFSQLCEKLISLKSQEVNVNRFFIIVVCHWPFNSMWASKLSKKIFRIWISLKIHIQAFKKYRNMFFAMFEMFTNMCEIDIITCFDVKSKAKVNFSKDINWKHLSMKWNNGSLKHHHSLV